MQVLIVNHQEVQQSLPMNECMDVMEDTLKMLSQGSTVNPLRQAMWLPDKSGLIGMMPAYLGDTGVMGLKAISINAAGSSVAFARELDTAAVLNAKLFVDRKESTVNEAGDFLFPKNEGAIDDDHIRGEIGDLLLEKIGGRASSEEITLFKSLGLAVEDVASAHYIHQKLLKQNEGVRVEFGALKSE
jgi:ornithine cyclodeaminase/alanine dehydrogenase-like protein (mu-crystallin family)